MNFLKQSLLFSTSLLLGVHSTWAMEDDAKELQASIHIKKSGDLKHYIKNGVHGDTFLVTLSRTQIPHDQKDKRVFQDFPCCWEVTATQRTEARPARTCAEETSFIDLSQLLGLSPSIPYNEQNSVRFTHQDKQTLLDFYFQGKIDLTWTRNGYNFKQYCTHRDASFHTLAVTSKKDEVTYYKQQRYSDNSHSEICDIFCDSRFQVEYWKDKKSWVVDHPDEGKKRYTTRRMALKMLKGVEELSVEARILGAEEGVLSFFSHPDAKWARDKAERENEESPSYWKAGLVGWLALSGDFLGNHLNTPSFKAKNTNGGKETQSNENEMHSSNVPIDYESSFANIFSNFSPYSVIPSLLVSFLASKDGKFNYLQFFSIASTAFTGVEGILEEKPFGRPRRNSGGGTSGTTMPKPNGLGKPKK